LIYIDIWRAWIPVNPQVPGSSPGRGAIKQSLERENVLGFSVTRLSHGFTSTKK